MISLVVYLIGFVVMYLITKQLRNNMRANKWEDVVLSFMLSLFSWIGIVVTLLTLLLSLITDKFKDTKPPKWL